MNCFFVRILKNICFLILFVLLSLLLVDSSIFALTTNHNTLTAMSKITSEKEIVSFVAYIDFSVAMWLSAVYCKKNMKLKIEDFSKQANSKKEYLIICMLTKVNKFNEDVNCCLQLRI